MILDVTSLPRLAWCTDLSSCFCECMWVRCYIHVNRYCYLELFTASNLHCHVGPFVSLLFGRLASGDSLLSFCQCSNRCMLVASFFWELFHARRGLLSKLAWSCFFMQVCQCNLTSLILIAVSTLKMSMLSCIRDVPLYVTLKLEERKLLLLEWPV